MCGYTLQQFWNVWKRTSLKSFCSSSCVGLFPNARSSVPRSLVETVPCTHNATGGSCLYTSTIFSIFYSSQQGIFHGRPWKVQHAMEEAWISRRISAYLARSQVWIRKTRERLPADIQIMHRLCGQQERREAWYRTAQFRSVDVQTAQVRVCEPLASLAWIEAVVVGGHVKWKSNIFLHFVSSGKGRDAKKIVNRLSQHNRPRTEIWAKMDFW